MKNNIWLVIILFVFLSVSCSANKQDPFLLYHKIGKLPIQKVISFSDRGIGIVQDNKIRFFHWWYDGNGVWDEINDMEIVLPLNCKDVFSNVITLGIIINNKINFYFLDDSNWKEENEKTFILPKNCQGAFVFSTGIGIIADNKIKFYNFNEDKKNWEEIPEIEFVLPENCKGVFEFGYGDLFVIVDNRIKIFTKKINDEENNSYWIEINEAEYILDNNYRAVVNMRFWLGIANDNEVKVYNYFEDGWEELENVIFNYNKLN